MIGAPIFRYVLTPGWAGDSLTRAAQAVPSLDLNFAVTKNVGPLVTFTRASSATYIDSAGTLQTAAVDVPRFDHNPTTGESLGLLMEDQRTNLLVGSAAPATQIVTVTAVAHTLHFTGTGTITLTGASTAGPLVGTGTGEANRVSLTFTPTAGSLTLTVSGTVTNAQLEAGAFRTSYILNVSTPLGVTRNADVANITGANFSSWYRQDEGTVFASAGVQDFTQTNFPRLFSLDRADVSSNFIAAVRSSSTRRLDYSVFADATGQAVGLNNGIAPAANTTVNGAWVYKANDFIGAVNGVLTNSDTSGSVPTLLTTFGIGMQGNATLHYNGTIKRLTFFPQRLPNSTLQAITQ
jgi:hypothetical protein